VEIDGASVCIEEAELGYGKLYSFEASADYFRFEDYYDLLEGRGFVSGLGAKAEFALVCLVSDLANKGWDVLSLDSGKFLTVQLDHRSNGDRLIVKCDSLEFGFLGAYRLVEALNCA